MCNFEKLDVWTEAIAFADLVYSISRGFPDDEGFGLTTQMRRAAVSISSNLAEGSSRVSRSDFARFVEIGTGRLLKSFRKRSSENGRDSSAKGITLLSMRRRKNKGRC
jgi:23S rRNA-intervening sequence protein